jgi:hypothetical protein
LGQISPGKLGRDDSDFSLVKYQDSSTKPVYANPEVLFASLMLIKGKRYNTIIMLILTLFSKLIVTLSITIAVG